jgi:hypothetical protein
MSAMGRASSVAQTVIHDNTGFESVAERRGVRGSYSGAGGGPQAAQPPIEYNNVTRTLSQSHPNAPAAGDAVFMFTSIASRVLLRFVCHLAEALKQPPQSIFLMRRYQQRFADVLHISDPGSDDDLMIRIVEQCFIDVGYAVLRALAAVRTMGSAPMRELSLFAMLRSMTLLTQFTGLTLCIHSDLRVNSFAQYQSKVVMTQAAEESAKFIGFFVRSSASQYPQDTVFNDSSHFSRFNMPQSTQDSLIDADEKAMALTSLADYVYHPIITFTRLVMQATRCALRACADFDTGYLENGKWMPPAVKIIAEELQACALRPDADQLSLDVALDRCLAKVDDIRRAALGLNVDLQNYVEMAGGHMASMADDQTLLSFASDPRVQVRMTLVEVVSVTVYQEKATRNRSDLTRAISMRLAQMRESDWIDLLAAMAH